MALPLAALQRGEASRQLQAHTSWVQALAISPDGRTVAHAIAAMLVRKALRGNIAACRIILDRTEGKVRDRAAVTVAIRPEKLRVQATPEGAGGESGTALPAKVAARSYLAEHAS